MAVRANVLIGGVGGQARGRRLVRRAGHGSWREGQQCSSKEQDKEPPHDHWYSRISHSMRRRGPWTALLGPWVLGPGGDPLLADGFGGKTSPARATSRCSPVQHEALPVHPGHGIAEV